MQVYYKTHSATQFFIMFLGDYAHMLAHLGVRLYGPKHLPILVKDLVFIQSTHSTMFFICGITCVIILF